MSNIHGDVRKISHNLMPVDFKQKSINDVINDYCDQMKSSNLKTMCFDNSVGKLRISDNKARIIYRVIQELIQNVIKHANAKHCTVQFSSFENKMNISIEDDGVGFENVDQNGQGLKSIEKRLNNIDGEFSIESNKGEGTLCVITIPAE